MLDMAKARLLIRERVVYPDGALAEFVVWVVPSPIEPSRHAFKYRLAYVVGGKWLIGYDNERGKGDHRHMLDRERSYRFTTIDALLADFVADIEKARSE